MSTLTPAQQEQALNLQDFLRREQHIRFAGMLLTLSPIGNFFWSAALSGAYHWYTPHVLWVIAQNISGTLWFLWGSAFTAGLLMLRGRRSSWTFTLCILGMNVVFGIISFKKDIELGWVQPTISLLINIGLFALIYTQEFHQRLERKIRAARMNRPFSLTVNGGGLKAQFEGIGVWGTITEITNLGLRIQAIGDSAPKQIEFRPVELAIGADLVLKARFSARNGSDYFFRFTGMTPTSLNSLYRWAHRVGTRLSRQAQGGSSPDFKSAAG